WEEDESLGADAHGNWTPPVVGGLCKYVTYVTIISKLRRSLYLLLVHMCDIGAVCLLRGSESESDSHI
ncbi:hypothetical protein Tco_1086852, partial [Tanacetum coccineum]